MNQDTDLILAALLTLILFLLPFLAG